MAETFIQLAPDSTGKKLRTRTKNILGQTVHEQAVYQTALPTFFAVADAVALAQNKHHISIFNATVDKMVTVRKLFQINNQLTAVTGVALRFSAFRSTAQSAGTAITPVTADTNDVLPAGVNVATGATVTNGGLLFPYTTQSDEISAANTAVANYLTQYGNLMLESPEIKELRLRPSEGFTVQQITNSTVGSFAWLMAFTVDDDL
ncbi:MAG: hypothetical protein PWQ61_3202 [Betaproteobacteria bacterium]|nr:hypothetical protein [Betaproteobacteria bacterium]